MARKKLSVSGQRALELAAPAPPKPKPQPQPKPGDGEEEEETGGLSITGNELYPD